jgi:hypothetical protein
MIDVEVRYQNEVNRSDILDGIKERQRVDAFSAWVTAAVQQYLSILISEQNT